MHLRAICKTVQFSKFDFENEGQAEGVENGTYTVRLQMLQSVMTKF